MIKITPIFLFVTFFYTVTAQNTTCNQYEFQCPMDGRCINCDQLCDTYADCEDAADEKGCGSLERPSCPCQVGVCANKRCLPSCSSICNQINECGDGSDEKACGTSEAPKCTCRENEFACDNGKCIPAHWKCDGDYDCDYSREDDSDERDCPATERPECRLNQYECGDGSCIPCFYLCDEYPDCSNNEDEMNCGTVDEPTCGNNSTEPETTTSVDPE